MELQEKVCVFQVLGFKRSGLRDVNPPKGSDSECGAHHHPILSMF